MITDSYDPKSPAIVSLEIFYGPKQHKIDKCLILFSKYIYEYLLQNHACKKIAEVGACNGNIDVWTMENGGETIGFYLTNIGSALAGDLVAEVNHLTGATKFVMFGSCGSLCSEATNGKFILPTEAYRGEGMSYYFAPPADYIKIRNADRLAGFFEEMKIPFVKGRVWTTDCMLRETVALVNRRRAEGCIAVEMEVAGVEAVCDYLGLELYDFLAAGDVLLEGDYNIENLSGANHDLDKLFIALDIAKTI